MFTFEYSPEEAEADDQDKASRCLQADSLANITPVLSPAKKASEDVETPLNVDITEISPQSIAKTEKGSSEEGFCCVMSMHDGVVL